MPAENTVGDAVRIYLTGAASDGGAQADPAASLGNYRSSTELAQLAFAGAMANITTELIPGHMEVGQLLMESDGSGNLRVTRPGRATPGAYVAVADGTTQVLEDDVNQAWIRVSRSGATLPKDTVLLDLVDVYNALWANVAEAERAAGSAKYRAVMLKNGSAAAVTLRIYLGVLGTSVTANAVYAASGAVSISTGGNFKDWPAIGFVKNLDSGEVMYYASRTDSALAVAAGGRDVYTDVAGGAAGASGDRIRSISGLRLASETPAASAIQTIADEDTAPTGRTWQHPADGDDPDTIEEIDLAAGSMLGLWIERTVIAGAEPQARQKNRIVVAHWVP